MIPISSLTPLNAIPEFCTQLHEDCEGEAGCRKTPRPLTNDRDDLRLPTAFAKIVLKDRETPATRGSGADRTCQVEDCPDSVTVNNNKRVRLCNAHADASSSSSAGGGIFLQWVPAARAETAARRFFPEQGWYLVRYCKQRAHTKWLGAFRRDVKTGELQRNCCACLMKKKVSRAGKARSDAIRSNKRSRGNRSDDGGGDGGKGGGNGDGDNNGNNGNNKERYRTPSTETEDDEQGDSKKPRCCPESPEGQQQLASAPPTPQQPPKTATGSGKYGGKGLHAVASGELVHRNQEEVPQLEQQPWDNESGGGGGCLMAQPHFLVALNVDARAAAFSPPAPPLVADTAPASPLPRDSTPSQFDDFDFDEAMKNFFKEFERQGRFGKDYALAAALEAEGELAERRRGRVASGALQIGGEALDAWMKEGEEGKEEEVKAAASDFVDAAFAAPAAAA